MNTFFLYVDSPPEQCANNFQFKLPSAIELDGTWGVALCELSYINNHFNVLPGENLIRVELPLDKKADTSGELFRKERFSLSPGSYADLPNLCRVIQRSLQEYDKTANVIHPVEK